MSPPPAILALDQGTTSSRAIVFDHAGAVRAVAQREFSQIFPQTGWVEHDPVEIWQTQLATAREALDRAGLKAGDLAAIGITNQRETTVVWDRKTGAPVHNAIVWQDRRTASFCDDLKRAGHADLVQRKAGWSLTPISRAASCAGCSTMCPAPATARGAGNSPSAPWTPGFCGT